MKKTILFLLLISSIVLGSCQKESIGKSSSNSSALPIGANERNASFNEDIGAYISDGMADTLIDEFSSFNPDWTASSVILESSTINDILGQTNCIGLSVTYGIDNNDNPVLLFAGVNDSLQLMEGETYSSASGGTLLSTSTWNSYSSNFSSNNDLGYSGHFIGKNILEDQMSISGVYALNIYLGQESSGGHKLVIYPYDTNGNVSGKAADASTRYKPKTIVLSDVIKSITDIIVVAIPS